MMKLFALFFLGAMTAGVSVVVFQVDPVILAGLAALVVLGALLLIYGILSLQAKIAVAKLEAGRPILPPAKAAPVVVMPARFVPDPVEDARRRLAQGAAEEVVSYVVDPGNQPPARRPRQWRVVNG